MAFSASMKLWYFMNPNLHVLSMLNKRGGLGGSCSLPFALASSCINDGLGALDISKPTAVRMQHLIAGIRM